MRTSFRKRFNEDRLVLLGAGLGAVAGAATYYWTHRSETLAGQVAVIAGGSRGLGLELARQFARKVCQIVIFARRAGTRAGKRGGRTRRRACSP